LRSRDAINTGRIRQFPFALTVDSANPPWPTWRVGPRRASPGRAARGSVVPRKMACHSAAGRQVSSLGPRPSTRARRGSLVAAPCE
jgi:hypothetical protein